MDIDKLIAANMGLVYNQLHKLNLANDDDAFSCGLEGLANAVKTYDSSKNVTFGTYASVCIYNAIACYLRTENRKRKLHVVYYEDPIGGAEDLTYIDVLSDNETPESSVLESELYSELWEAYDAIVNDMPDGVSKDIVLAWRASDFIAPQMELAKLCNTSQAHVSRTLSAFKHKLKQRMEEYLC